MISVFDFCIPTATCVHDEHDDYERRTDVGGRPIRLGVADLLSRFLLSVDLRAGVANKTYVVYAMERLETCLMNERFLRFLSEIWRTSN